MCNLICFADILIGSVELRALIEKKKFEIFLRVGYRIENDFILVGLLENASREFVKNDVLFYCLI
jgi:hypothetical protein